MVWLQLTRLLRYLDTRFTKLANQMIIDIEKTLSPLRQPFVIVEDGTSQTDLRNNGRVGFHVERLFGIRPNSHRDPDLGSWEIKTTRPGTKVSIGTMPADEFWRIKHSSSHIFSLSEPYKKMKNTLFVFYEKIEDYPDPVYIMRGWGTCELDRLSATTKSIIENDYKFICGEIARRASRETLTDYLKKYGVISGNYLSLAYKGDRDYVYPAWSFTGKFMNSILHK